MPHITDTIATQQSEVWQTNTGIIETDGGVILVDPGVLASEIGALVESLGGKPIVAGFATHYHWDHILWTPELGDAPRYASAETCELVVSQRDRILTSLDRFEEHVAQEYQLDPQWDRSRFFDLQPMTPGPDTIAGVACELVEIPGHANGQVALVLPGRDVAFVADTLSNIEVPSLAEGKEQLARYLDTLDRLQAIIDRVSWIIPGHGTVADREEARERLDADRRYLNHLAELADAWKLDPSTGSNEEVARNILDDLLETRAEDGLSWQMHVDNVRMLREGTPAS